MTEQKEDGRRLSRTETHDLSMIIKDRTKVLRAHAEEQAAACLADFEKQLAAVYSFDKDEVWKKAAEEAMKVCREQQAVVDARCKELGIPSTFAPAIGVTWHGRGESALASRRAELRRVAKSSIDAMFKAAITKIERQSLDLRTQVVAMGLLSDNAKLFLDSLAPVEEAMRNLDFVEMEQKLEKEKTGRLTDQRRNLYGVIMEHSEWYRVKHRLGGKPYTPVEKGGCPVICDRCGATLYTYGDICKNGFTAPPCPGYLRIEKAATLFDR